MTIIEDSQLYKYLIFLQKYDPGYNVKEVFNLILGYQLASNEEWISKLNNFIDKKLIVEYYNDSLDKLPENYGNVIYANQSNDKEGLEKFYSFLSDFIQQENNLPSQC